MDVLVLLQFLIKLVDLGGALNLKTLIYSDVLLLGVFYLLLELGELSWVVIREVRVLLYWLGGWRGLGRVV